MAWCRCSGVLSSFFLSGATFAAFGWRHINTVFAVGCKNTVKPCQIHSRLRDHRRQLGNEIQRFEDDMRGAITVGRFELISDIP